MFDISWHWHSSCEIQLTLWHCDKCILFFIFELEFLWIFEVLYSGVECVSFLFMGFNVVMLVFFFMYVEIILKLKWIHVCESLKLKNEMSFIKCIYVYIW